MPECGDKVSPMSRDADEDGAAGMGIPRAGRPAIFQRMDQI